MLELYSNIRKYRKELHMSQEELAKKTGYTDRSSIAKIEKGTVDLPQSKIILFAEALNVTPGELMGSVEDDVQTSGQQIGYYDDETAKAHQEMYDDPNLHALMDAAMGCRPEYIRSAIQLLKTLKETNIDG